MATNAGGGTGGGAGQPSTEAVVSAVASLFHRQTVSPIDGGTEQRGVDGVDSPWGYVTGPL